MESRNDIAVVIPGIKGRDQPCLRGCEPGAGGDLWGHRFAPLPRRKQIEYLPPYITERLTRCRGKRLWGSDAPAAAAPTQPGPAAEAHTLETAQYLRSGLPASVVHP